MRTIEERILNVKGIDYIVREDGKIFSTHNRGRAKYHQEIKQRMNSDGYMCITVGKTGNRTVASVHRLVAKAFIPNPLNLPEVNHKDYNRANNSVDNLEWCSHKENIDYAMEFDDEGNITYIEQPIGVFVNPEGYHLEYDKEHDKTYVIADAVIYNDYCAPACEIIQRKQGSKY